MSRHNNIFYLFILLLLSTSSASAQTQTIGAMAELTGNFARSGEDCKRGYEVAKATSLLGVSSDSRLVIVDNQNDPKVAISEFRRLKASEKASIIITTRSPVGLALNPISKQTNTPLIGIVGHPKFISENPYAVRAFPSAKDESGTLAGYVVNQPEEQIAVVTLEDDYFLSFSNEFKAQLNKTAVVFSETVPPSEMDFAPIILRIKASGSDAIFANITPSQFLPFVKKLRELGVNNRVYSNFLIGSSDIRTTLGSEGDGIVFVEVDYRKTNFLAALKRVTGATDSSAIGYSCYVAMNYALTAINQATQKKVSIIDTLNSVSEIDTLDGVVPILNREAKFSIAVKMLQDTEIKTLQ